DVDSRAGGVVHKRADVHAARAGKSQVSDGQRTAAALAALDVAAGVDADEAGDALAAEGCAGGHGGRAGQVQRTVDVELARVNVLPAGVSFCAAERQRAVADLGQAAAAAVQTAGVDGGTVIGPDAQGHGIVAVVRQGQIRGAAQAAESEAVRTDG